MSKQQTLAEEAKKYSKRKHTSKTMKPLTSRRYLAGQALCGILASARGSFRMEDVRRQAYEWADFMLDDD